MAKLLFKAENSHIDFLFMSDGVCVSKLSTIDEVLERFTWIVESGKVMMRTWMNPHFWIAHDFIQEAHQEYIRGLIEE